MPRLENPFRTRKNLGPDDETTLVLTYRELARMLNWIPDNEHTESIRKKIHDRLQAGGFRV